MAAKSSKNKKKQDNGMSWEKRRMRNMQVIFLVISTILILSMLLSAVVR